MYVAGWGRSGSTLLETLLTDDTTVCVGETFQLWSRSPLAHYCSCGDALPDCPVWGGVVDAFDRPWDAVVDEMRGIRRRVLRTRYARSLVRPARWAGSVDVERYAHVMRTLYQRVAQETGATTVIDSSKLPLDLAALAHGDLALRVVHLVRDPRAVAASWKRTVEWQMPDGQTLRMPTHRSLVVRGPLGPLPRADLDGAAWDRRPRPAGQLREPRAPRSRRDRRVGRLHRRARPRRPGRTRRDDRARRAGAARDRGNPGRRSGAALIVREDDAWRTELSASERAAVGALGLPYLALQRTHLVRS